MHVLILHSWPVKIRSSTSRFCSGYILQQYRRAHVYQKEAKRADCSNKLKTHYLALEKLGKIIQKEGKAVNNGSLGRSTGTRERGNKQAISNRSTIYPETWIDSRVQLHNAPSRRLTIENIILLLPNHKHRTSDLPDPCLRTRPLRMSLQVVIAFDIEPRSSQKSTLGLNMVVKLSPRRKKNQWCHKKTGLNGSVAYKRYG